MKSFVNFLETNQEPHENSNSAIFVKKDKKYSKGRDHYYYTGEYRGAAHNIYNLKYSILKETTMIFYNKSNCDYHFIIKELAEEFEGQFTF